MQKSITESEARIERKMQQFTERKIVEVNQLLDAFKLRVPEPVEPAEDTVLAALFATSEITSPSPRESAKRSRGRSEDEARARKK